MIWIPLLHPKPMMWLILIEEKKEEIIVFCHNIEGRLQYLRAVSYDPHDWHLFLNSLKQSLKCVLNQNGNEYASVPIGHSDHVNETYTSVKQLLSLIKYDDHKWVICVDLKMVNVLLTQRGGYTTKLKHPIKGVGGTTFQKLSHLGEGGTKRFARNRGQSFLLLYSSIIFTVCGFLYYVSII